jgi:glyoxylase-like metal-dependent hydrolase (beta-lactamase superfamily II)
MINYYYDKDNLVEGENKIGCFSFNVIYTPGHKEDLITIYFKKDKAMFCGDFIFKDSIGRWDLDGGNIKDMFKSIDKIKRYDRDITIYPGHGEKTTLGYEMDNNMYFRNILT